MSQATARAGWRKSSYSTNGGECIECASASWSTSSYSGAHGENCVECASASWAKSSHSANSANCVECASATWTKSSHSNGNGGECVEYAPLPTSIAVRDSKHPDAGHLDFPGAEWFAFVGALKHSTLDA